MPDSDQRADHLDQQPDQEHQHHQRHDRFKRPQREFGARDDNLNAALAFQQKARAQGNGRNDADEQNDFYQ